MNVWAWIGDPGAQSVRLGLTYVPLREYFECDAGQMTQQALSEEAQRLVISGRSDIQKDELAEAVEAARQDK